MGTSLEYLQRKNTYRDLLHLDNSNAGVDSTLRPLVDGGGGDSALHLGTKEIGVGALGTTQTGLRMASEHASACYWVSVDKAEFNGTPDHVGIWGWNTAYVGGYNVVAGEPSLSMQIESNYDTGTDEWMEWMVQYHPDTGSGANSRRPFQCAVNRATHEVWSTITGRVSCHDNDGTQNMVFNPDGSINFIRAYINQTTNGVSFLKQINAAQDAFLNLIFLDSVDRAVLPSVYSRATTAGHHTQENREVTNQTGDLFRAADSFGTLLSRLNSGGYFMTKKTSAPADGDIESSEVALWFDDTDGAGKLMIKGKTANGTVVAGEVALT